MKFQVVLGTVVTIQDFIPKLQLKQERVGVWPTSSDAGSQLHSARIVLPRCFGESHSHCFYYSLHLKTGNYTSIIIIIIHT